MDFQATDGASEVIISAPALLWPELPGGEDRLWRRGACGRCGTSRMERERFGVCGRSRRGLRGAREEVHRIGFGGSLWPFHDARFC